MSWARFDDKFWAHPKVLIAGNAAVGAFCRACCYCAAHHTDGFLNNEMARFIGGFRIFDKLVECELAERVNKGEQRTVSGRTDAVGRKRPDVVVRFKESGYFIADFLHYNATRKEIEQKRTNAAEGGRAKGLREAHAKADATAHAVANDVAPPSRPVYISKSSNRPYRTPERAVDKLLESLSDQDALTRVTIERICRKFKLSEGDIMLARECATGPGVQSASAVAISQLSKAGEAKVAATAKEAV